MQDLAIIKKEMTIRDLKDFVAKISDKWDDAGVGTFDINSDWQTLDGIELDTYGGEVLHVMLYFDLPPDIIKKHSK